MKSLQTIEFRKKLAETEAVEHYEMMLRGRQKEETYDKLRHVFRVALCNSDYDGQHHIDSLAMLYDLMDTIQHAINPEIKRTVCLHD